MTSKKLVKATPQVPVFQLNFDQETKDLIKKTVAVDATDTELQMFLYQAQKSGLDPLARQIYFIKRKVKKADGTWESKVNIQASIDGLRLVAQRNGHYAGQDEPEFTEVNGKLTKVKVTVYKFGPGGQRYPAAVGVAYWSEYVPQGNQAFMWNKMPHTMLAKVAEALALRKAFPQELSGIYTAEEMEQAGEPAKPVEGTVLEGVQGTTPSEEGKSLELEKDEAPWLNDLEEINFDQMILDIENMSTREDLGRLYKKLEKYPQTAEIQRLLETITARGTIIKNKGVTNA